MAIPRNQTVSLSAEQADYIDNLIISGAFASATEVVQAGLSALQDHASVLDHWLIDQVVPVARAMKADPGRAISADDVFDRIRRLHAETVAASGHDL